MEIKWGDKKKNLDTFKQLISHVEQDTDIVVLPETFSTGFLSPEDLDYIKETAETINGETISLIKEECVRHQFAIAGSFVSATSEGFFNKAFFAMPDGNVKFADKRHLFAYGGENKIFVPGTDRLSLNYKGWNIAMIICYDLRFPVWCRNFHNEYDILLTVANWPASRIDVWNTLLKARALENSSYVCGVNCKGIDDRGSEYNGESSLFDFKGKDLAIKLNNVNLLYASAVKQELDNYRTKFPIWKDADQFELKI